MFIGKLLTTLSDTLFPPREDERIVRTLTDNAMQELYQPHTKDSWTALSLFKDARVRALVHEAKYEHSAQAQKLLAEFIHMYAKDNEKNTETIWVPIPLSPARLRARGYNQVEAILAQSHVPFVRNVLARIRDTKPQTTLTRAERLLNMNNAFMCVSPELVRGKSIIIVDDVITTGATLRAAESALLEHGPKSITLLALAH